jgi:hypothetical protein
MEYLGLKAVASPAYPSSHHSNLAYLLVLPPGSTPLSTPQLLPRLGFKGQSGCGGAWRLVSKLCLCSTLVKAEQTELGEVIHLQPLHLGGKRIT